MLEENDQSGAGSADTPSLAHHVSQLLPLSAAQRGEYLQQLETDVAGELEELLAFQSTALDLSELAGVTVAQALLRGNVPARLGRWQVGKPLGQGGMGSVYLATREELGVVQLGAAKRGHSQSQTAAALAAVQREAGALSELHHGGIARLLDYGTDEVGLPFVVSEYVDGLPLLSYLKQHQPDRAGRLALFDQLLDAVAAAHASLVLHLDLKPDNILVTDMGRTKLIDFGLSGLGGEKPSGYTQAFASPEQLAGLPVSVAADIFSLGKVLDQLLGFQPSVANPELDAIVALATAEKADDRYPSALAMKLDIEAIEQLKPVSPLRHQRSYRWGKFLRRQWLPVGLSVLTLAVLVAGLVSAFARNKEIQLERDRALDLLASERATSSFVTDAMREASVFGGGDSSITVVEMMHQMLEALPGEEEMSPRAKSWLASDLAAVFTGVGQMDAALKASELAVESATQSEEIEDDIAHWTQRALTAGVAHQYSLALEAAQTARDLALPVNHWRLPWTYLAEMQTHLAMKQWGEVVALFDVIEKIPTDRASVAGNIHYMRGVAFTGLERFAEAQADLAAAEQIYAEVFGGRSGPVADVRFREFQRLIGQGSLAQATTGVEDLRALVHETYGQDHYRSVLLDAEVAWLDFLLGGKNSGQVLDTLLPTLIRLLGEQSPQVAVHQIRRARIANGALEHDRVVVLLDLAEQRLASLPEENPDRLNLMLTRAEHTADLTIGNQASEMLLTILNRLEPEVGSAAMWLRAAILGSRVQVQLPGQAQRCQRSSNLVSQWQDQGSNLINVLSPANQVRFQNMMEECSRI